jgi:four helix bundle protein
MEQGTRNKGPEGQPGFKGLLAWQKADELASLVFRSMRALPPAERWLANQAARAAVSVPANIAEGYGRGSINDYLRFLDIARGSLAELEYYIHFMTREGLVTGEPARDLVQLRLDAANLLGGLWKSLKSKADSWDHTGRYIREEGVAYSFEAPN